MKTRNLPFARTALTAGVALLSLPAFSQSQSLAFTGGVLLNTKVNFRNLGVLGPAAAAGPATGAAVNRTYDDGFNNVDGTGNKENQTANWGYGSSSQISGGNIVMSANGGAASLDLRDAGDALAPSGNLEYRGSFGSLGSSDWGMLLGVGYQSAGGKESGAYVTDGLTLKDSYSLGGLTAADLPPPPYTGAAGLKSPRIGSVPTRSFATVPGARVLSGNWEIDAQLVPITGGVYLESQLFGRLNAIASAGVLALLVNSDFKFSESSAYGGSPAVRTVSSTSASKFLIGGFVQLGLDLALWENTSLVVGGRWQPCETFSQNALGREAELDFTSAFAIHAGFSMRF